MTSSSIVSNTCCCKEEAMTPHQELSKLRKEEICPQLSKTHCKKYIDWHRRAKLEGIDWQKLEALADSGQVVSKKKRVEFKAGTKLLREYQHRSQGSGACGGKTHQVLTTSEGFLYESALYKSLTAIANAITGKKWNGKAFFKIGA